MKNNIKTVDNLLDAISEKLYITKTNTYQNELLELEEIYNNIIVIVIEGLNTKLTESFLQFEVKELENTKKNIDEYEKKIINDMNQNETMRAYSFLPTGLGHYENQEELINQIIRQSTLEETKYIYVYIKLNDINTLTQELKQLTQELKNTFLIILGKTSDSKVPLLLWKEKEKKETWTIRYPKENEYSPFIRMAREYERLYKNSRKDIFDGNIPYGKGEFRELCNPHQLKTLLLYEEDKNILGFIEAELIITEGYKNLMNMRIMRINRLFVKEDRRREKIATRLYEKIWKKAIENKCDNLTVKVYNFTPEGKEFFESLGLNILSYQYEIKVPQK